MSMLCHPIDCNLTSSFVHGILQARILEWVAFSRRSSWPRDWTQVSCIVGWFFANWATWEPHDYENHANFGPPAHLQSLAKCLATVSSQKKKKKKLPKSNNKIKKNHKWKRNMFWINSLDVNLVYCWILFKLFNYQFEILEAFFYKPGALIACISKAQIGKEIYPYSKCFVFFHLKRYI